MSRLFLAMLFLAGSLPVPAAAQSQEGVEQFYRPVKSRDLITHLPPRTDRETSLENDEDFFAFEGNGCPDEINIGSISDDTDIFGGVDIEVILENDIIIQCGGL